MLPGGFVGKQDISRREESSCGGRSPAQGRRRGLREVNRVARRSLPHLRRNNGPRARPARRLPQAAPPARRAAGACSSSWLCPDVIQTWQQFDFKGEPTDLPDTSSGAKGNGPRGRGVRATVSEPLSRRGPRRRN
ncbi:uncharacterized protein LOC144577883 [Callithrix jacchus]